MINAAYIFSLISDGSIVDKSTEIAPVGVCVPVILEIVNLLSGSKWVDVLLFGTYNGTQPKYDLKHCNESAMNQPYC